MYKLDVRPLAYGLIHHVRGLQFYTEEKVNLFISIPNFSVAVLAVCD